MSAILQALLTHLSNPHQTLQVTKLLHSLTLRSNLLHNPIYPTRLIRLYSLNKGLITARKLFDESPHRSIYLWNSIIRAYAQYHLFTDSYSLFLQMQKSDIRPCNYTFACIARACTEDFNVDGFRLVHSGLIVSGYEFDIVCCSALVVGYSKMGLISLARLVFNRVHCPDLILWNSMIAAYGNIGMWEESLTLFHKIRVSGEVPDRYTFVGILSSLEHQRLLMIGEALHCLILKSSFDSSDHVASVLVTMYSRCKSLASAFKLFKTLHQPDMVTQSALITGLSQSGHCETALLMFSEMIHETKRTDHLLIASILAACAKLSSFKSGIETHGYIIRHGYESETMVASALIDFYSKCGFIHLGTHVFKAMPNRNIVSYNSLILGFGLHGLATEAFELFHQLKHEGLKPDESTFSALLCTCCHSGLEKKGREIFIKMVSEFGVQPKTEHYVYFVKLIGMAGRVEEAYELIMSLKIRVDCSVWGALMSCSEVNGNSEVAEIVGRKILEEKSDGNVYGIMLSNVYCGDGRWDDACKLRESFVKFPVMKTRGISRLEIGGRR